MRRGPVHALVRLRVEPLVLATLDVAPEGALAPPGLRVASGASAPAPAVAPRPCSHPRPPVRLGGFGPGSDRRASGGLGPGPARRASALLAPPAVGPPLPARAAAPAGRREALRASSGGSPPVLVSGSWGACSVPVRPDNPCAAAPDTPDRLFAPDKALLGIDTPSESGTLRAGTRRIDLRPAPQPGSCSTNPGTERGLTPERKPPWTHRLDSPRSPPPSRRGCAGGAVALGNGSGCRAGRRHRGPGVRAVAVAGAAPAGLARSPGPSLTVARSPLGSERASRSRPSSSGADTPRPERQAPASYREHVHSLPWCDARCHDRRHGRLRGLLAHRWVRGGHHGAGRLRAAPTRPGRSAEHRRATVNTSTRCHGVTLAAMTGGTADSAGCSLTAGFGAGLTEQVVFERRRHAPAGAPSTGELT